MILEKRFEKTIDRMRAQAAVPLRLELWNGCSFDFCGEPSFIR